MVVALNFPNRDPYKQENHKYKCAKNIIVHGYKPSQDPGTLFFQNWLAPTLSHAGPDNSRVWRIAP